MFKRLLKLLIVAAFLPFLLLAGLLLFRIALPTIEIAPTVRHRRRTR